MERASMKRNMFGMSNHHRTTFEIGRLIPFMWEDTLPGDLWNLKHEIMLRFLPLYFPIMHTMDITMHYFYIPNRIMFRNGKRGWEQFMEDETGVEHPTIRMDLGDASGSNILDPEALGCYLGLPFDDLGITTVENITAFPAAAYAHIFDDYYRSNILQDEVADDLTEGDNPWARELLFEKPLRRGWNHDYFTSALPTAQTGDDVLIPLLGELPHSANRMTRLNGTSPGTGDIQLTTTGPTKQLSDSVGNPITFDPDLFNDNAATMREFRLAAQLLEYLEKANRIGDRYRDVIAGRFGFDPMPGVIDEPQYIGGSRGNVVIQDVMSTAQTVDGSDDITSVVGDYTGQALGLQSSKGHRFFAPEHGVIMGIMSVMPKSAYYQGIPRKFNRTSFFDYAWKEFAHIGDQAILNKEIFMAWQGTAAGNNDDTFGYTPRYQEYRSSTDTVSGLMRTTYERWHLARKFNSLPPLNAEFIECNPRIADVFRKVGENEHECFANILNNNTVYRNLPRLGIPRL